ncbi:hypothetical protein AB1K32_15085 [Metabacillus dongyingensis]|uniref:phage adaptor protein n=1 Tax=Metabacillus dongyingensis TaxID=2874282 RepID=UPI003B8BF2E6
MNLQQMNSEVLKDIDDTLTSEDIRGWLNRCLDDLTLVAKYQKMVTIPLLSGENSIVLPEDLQEIILFSDEECEFSEIPLRDKETRGYKKWSNVLSIQPIVEKDRTFTLYYYARLPHLTEVTDVPVIRPDFHDLLVLYAVAKAKYKDELTDMQQNAMQEYYTRKEEFAKEMILDNMESSQSQVISTFY